MPTDADGPARDEQARARLREELVREQRIPVHGDRPDLPSTAERFFPQARPGSLARDEFGDVDDGWYATEPPAGEGGWAPDDREAPEDAWPDEDTWGSGGATRATDSRRGSGDGSRASGDPRAAGSAGDTTGGRRGAPSGGRSAGAERAADRPGADPARSGRGAAARDAVDGPTGMDLGLGQGRAGARPQDGAQGVSGRSRKAATRSSRVASSSPPGVEDVAGPISAGSAGTGRGESSAGTGAASRRTPGAEPAGTGPGPAGAEGVAPDAATSAAADASGPELARAVLDAALAKRQQNNARRPRRRTGEPGEGKRLRGYSGPGPDPRDPQLFGAVLERLMKARGWERPKAEATVFGAWEKVVGPDIAQHSRPVKLDAGVLTVEAESTAWATQLRLLAATLLRNIAGEVGHNVVTKLNIHGPAAPSWNKGPRRVQGRGPRDTYG